MIYQCDKHKKCPQHTKSASLLALIKNGRHCKYSDNLRISKQTGIKKIPSISHDIGRDWASRALCPGITMKNSDFTATVQI
jgi:hypothetical protein